MGNFCWTKTNYLFEMGFTVEGNKDEMVCTLAALILNDAKVDLSEANLNSVITAAGASCAPHFPKGFAAVCTGVDLSKFLILRAGGDGGGDAPAVAAGAGAAAVVEEEEEEEEEEECDMGFSLFD